MKKVTLELYGDVHEFEMDDDETILDGALRNGIDAPYACMSGTCNSCQATVLEGEVQMEDADALTEDEIASGEILTCCAKPTTPTLKIKYPD
ncbi:MAG: 2Fe-2S iron-sulfur cluster binding domain-containing protein [Bdellovibrionales bacterium]|nr:2Fe-2S iron-sulfur cluster binding domain-containing protein [Bdellovibrionales bacterium]